jgi:hypothetical protein
MLAAGRVAARAVAAVGPALRAARTSVAQQAHLAQSATLVAAHARRTVFTAPPQAVRRSRHRGTVPEEATAQLLIQRWKDSAPATMEEFMTLLRDDMSLEEARALGEMLYMDEDARDQYLRRLAASLTAEDILALANPDLPFMSVIGAGAGGQSTVADKADGAAAEAAQAADSAVTAADAEAADAEEEATNTEEEMTETAAEDEDEAVKSPQYLARRKARVDALEKERTIRAMLDVEKQDKLQSHIEAHLRDDIDARDAPEDSLEALSTAEALEKKLEEQELLSMEMVRPDDETGPFDEALRGSRDGAVRVARVPSQPMQRALAENARALCLSPLHLSHLPAQLRGLNTASEFEAFEDSKNLEV